MTTCEYRRLNLNGEPSEELVSDLGKKRWLFDNRNRPAACLYVNAREVVHYYPGERLQPPHLLIDGDVIDAGYVYGGTVIVCSNYHGPHLTFRLEHLKKWAERRGRWVLCPLNLALEAQP